MHFGVGSAIETIVVDSFIQVPQRKAVFPTLVLLIPNEIWKQLKHMKEESPSFAWNSLHRSFNRLVLDGRW